MVEKDRTEVVDIDHTAMVETSHTEVGERITTEVEYMNGHNMHFMETNHIVAQHSINKKLVSYKKKKKKKTTTTTTTTITKQDTYLLAFTTFQYNKT